MTLFQGLSGAAILFLIGFWAGRAIRRIRRFNNGGALRAEPDAEDERAMLKAVDDALYNAEHWDEHPSQSFIRGLRDAKSCLSSFAALKQERDSLKAEVERLGEVVKHLNRLNETLAIKWHRLSEHITRLNKAHLKWMSRAKNYRARAKQAEAEVARLKGKP